MSGAGDGRGPALVYGLRDGKTVYVGDLPKSEGGARCGCVCPACGEPLVAKKGKAVKHHFAHAAGRECAHAGETGLHLKAKEIIAETRRVILPELTLQYEYTASRWWREIDASAHEYGARVLVKGPRYMTLESCAAEQWEPEGFRPDVTGSLGGRRLFVEIRVTHGIDDKKLEKIEQSGVSCLEVNLNSFKWREDSPAAISRALRTPGGWRWVFHSREAGEMEALMQRVEGAAEARCKRLWDERARKLGESYAPIRRALAERVIRARGRYASPALLARYGGTEKQRGSQDG